MAGSAARRTGASRFTGEWVNVMAVFNFFGTEPLSSQLITPLWLQPYSVRQLHSHEMIFCRSRMETPHTAATEIQNAHGTIFINTKQKLNSLTTHSSAESVPRNQQLHPDCTIFITNCKSLHTARRVSSV